ncbi:MAG: transporter [Lachnospiraceae bacterium]|nr:transporter [Lachnospiraceae bacterium]
MKGNIKIKDILMLQAVFFIYSINSIVAKLASEQEQFSFMFIMFYGLELVILGIYALLWQQIIKKFELSVAYANKAVTLIWGMIWGALLFKEQITPSKTAGILLVIVGIVILNGKKEEA